MEEEFEKCYAGDATLENEVKEGHFVLSNGAPVNRNCNVHGHEC